MQPICYTGICKLHCNRLIPVINQIELIVNNCHWLFDCEKTTREMFASQIGVCSRTIRRWEQGIITRYNVLGYYQTPYLNRRNWLDVYQRVLLLWINNEKQSGKTNDELFREVHNLELSRENFQSFMETRQ